MKKIMFNDVFGLTQAVLEGRKTQTRRLVGNNAMYSYPTDSRDTIRIDASKVPYKVGEVLAIAQSYKDLGFSGEEVDREPKTLKARGVLSKSAGWTNKMFVRAEACKHHIRITNVRVEILQAISDGDCLKEGISSCPHKEMSCSNHYPLRHCGECYDTPREAFSVLIDKVSGKGTWEGNPYVFVYDFELVK